MNAAADSTAVLLDYFDSESSLIYGIGNVGRQDDGLGWAFIDWLEAGPFCRKADTQMHYQLHLEDAELISRKQRVLFVDATKDVSVESFTLERAQPRMDLSFTSHAISIQSVMATCQLCFQRLPEVYVLAIRGYEWELQMGLTRQGKRNLDAAIAHVTQRRSVQVQEFC